MNGRARLDRPLPATSPLVRSLVVACCLLAGGIIVLATTTSERVVPRQPLSLLPWQLDGWQGRPGEALDRASVTALGVADFVNRVYVRAGEAPVAIYVGYYGTQRQGDTIHSPLNCLPGAGWEPTGRSRVEVPIGLAEGGKAPEPKIVVNRMTIRKGLDRDVVLYWYQGHGRVVASEYWGRLLLAYDAFRLHRTDGALVRVIAPVSGETPGAEVASERSAVAFVRALFPMLARYIPG